MEIFLNLVADKNLSKAKPMSTMFMSLSQFMNQNNNFSSCVVNNVLSTYSYSDLITDKANKNRRKCSFNL